MTTPMHPAAAESLAIDAAIAGLSKRSRALLRRRIAGEARRPNDGGAIRGLREHKCCTGWVPNDFGRKVAARLTANAVAGKAASTAKARSCKANRARKQTATERRISAGLGVAAE